MTAIFAPHSEILAAATARPCDLVALDYAAYRAMRIAAIAEQTPVTSWSGASWALADAAEAYEYACEVPEDEERLHDAARTLVAAATAYLARHGL